MSMAQPTEQGATTEPSATDGQAHELTLIFPLNPGGAERTRERSKTRDTGPGITGATFHNLRIVFFDNDTRMFFATVFDGDWDAYIDDLASRIPDQLDAMFGECVDYKGIHDPNIKDYIRKYQIKAEEFYCAYPNTTVKQIRKGQRVLKAWEEMLDASEE